MLQDKFAPLAQRMRPKKLDDIVGQSHLVGKGKVISQMIEKDHLTSMILWGPPGVGKTTIARLMATQSSASFVDCSAVTSGVKELREILNEARKMKLADVKTVLFVDEIHRFNKAQLDLFLPFVERGDVILVGATTENPSFEINAALLSRCRTFVLKSIATKDLTYLLQRAISDECGLSEFKIICNEEVLEIISNNANGDARNALNTLEMVVMYALDDEGTAHISEEVLQTCLNKRTLIYDKKGEEHYNLISALHKSMRNSDVDAAIYWLARMLEGGEQPLYIARRLIRFASEDIGLADQRVLQTCIDVYQACHFIGMPECSVHLTHGVAVCALAPKSNALYLAYEGAKQDALHMLNQEVPMQLRNAPTGLMKELGYGTGYEYAHDLAGKVSAMECLPEALVGKTYYHPTNQGNEAKILQYSLQLKSYKNKLKAKKG